MLRPNRPLRLAVIAAVCLAALPGVALAGPTNNLPTGSARVEFFTVPLDDTYTVPAGVPCSFPLQETEHGWIKVELRFDASGVAVAQAEHDHIVYTDTAFGVSVADSIFSTRFDAGDASVVQNADGTITYVARRVGHVSMTDAGNSIGLFDFWLVIDPVSGQELSFGITRSAGQTGGFFSSLDGSPAYCAQFTA